MQFGRGLTISILNTKNQSSEALAHSHSQSSSFEVGSTTGTTPRKECASQPSKGLSYLFSKSFGWTLVLEKHEVIPQIQRHGPTANNTLGPSSYYWTQYRHCQTGCRTQALFNQSVDFQREMAKIGEWAWLVLHLPHSNHANCLQMVKRTRRVSATVVGLSYRHG